MKSKIEKKIKELKKQRNEYAEIMQLDNTAFSLNRVQYLDCVSKITVLYELLED